MSPKVLFKGTPWNFIFEEPGIEDTCMVSVLTLLGLGPLPAFTTQVI